jgi:hypothetical protein
MIPFHFGPLAGPSLAFVVGAPEAGFADDGWVCLPIFSHIFSALSRSEPPSLAAAGGSGVCFPAGWVVELWAFLAAGDLAFVGDWAKAVVAKSKTSKTIKQSLIMSKSPF